MLYFVISVLVISLLLYCVLAGADFGAGILEIFKGKSLNRVQEKLITKAMGPVWEANHIWLILAIVILFVGFPTAFSKLSIILHIPLTAFLIGIIMRGCAFTFRHYDALQDNSHKYYSLIFAFSSAWSVLWMGICVGALIEANFPKPGSGFLETYIFSWLAPFPILMGLFLCSLFSFVAATFLIAEAPSVGSKELFKRRAIGANIFAVFIGLIILIYAYSTNIHSLLDFFSSTISITFFSISTLLILFQWIVIHKNKLSLLKYFGVAQLSLVFLAWIFIQYPYIFINKDRGLYLSILDSQAPRQTIFQLVIALTIGLILVIPPYLYLLRIFKKKVL